MAIAGPLDGWRSDRRGAQRGDQAVMAIAGPLDGRGLVGTRRPLPAGEG